MKAALRQRLDDAMTPRDLGKRLEREIDLALGWYRRRATSPVVTAAQWERRRRAFAAADRSAAALRRALDAIDRAWGQDATDGRPEADDQYFVSRTHKGLRREALACQETWREWLRAGYAPQRRAAHRPADFSRQQLGYCVVHSLMDAGALDRAEEVLRVVLSEADAIDGVQGRPRSDLYRVTKRLIAFVNQVRAIVKAEFARRQASR